MSFMSNVKSKALQLFKVFIIPTVILCALSQNFFSSPLRAETSNQRQERMAWWREAKFGLFIHWGLYSVPAGTWKGRQGEGVGEWLMFSRKIPVPEYEQLVPRFNPVKFDAAEWVSLAKAAGMKYLVITSKHHDGFALFDSQVSDYDIMDTPFGRDPLEELAEACRRQGIKLCFYHSILDWHHPDYLPRGEGSPRPWDTRPTDGARFDRYLEYMRAQLRELLSRYGPVGVLWFDGGWEHTPEELRAEETAAMIRGLQPGIIINDRLMTPQDFDTPEQYIPATGLPGRDWEVCLTMNDTWGYKSYDQNWKSSQDLIRKLVDIASKGGNFLLNVGPTAEGVIPAESVERLYEIGRWLNLNGESIYGAKASVFKRLGWGRCTVKPGKLFLHVFDWPADGRLSVPGLMNDIKNAFFLADPKKSRLRFERTGDVTFIHLPSEPMDSNDTVVVLEIAGEPQVAPQPIKPADGTIILRAIEADLHGLRLRYEEDKDAVATLTVAPVSIAGDGLMNLRTVALRPKGRN